MARKQISEALFKQINKKLKETPRHHQQDIAEDHAQEVFDIYEGKWKSKK